MVLLGGCYGVAMVFAMVLLDSCYSVARCCYGVAMCCYVTLGGC